MSIEIGRLIVRNGDHLVICLSCNDPDEVSTPIYHENIYPYSQHCCQCNVQIVTPHSTFWPELYSPTIKENENV